MRPAHVAILATVAFSSDTRPVNARAIPDRLLAPEKIVAVVTSVRNVMDERG